MKPDKPDPWRALAAGPVTPEEVLGRLERTLARERHMREQMEVLLEDRTRDLYLANEQLKAQHERLLLAEQRERARLARELEIAQCIQAAILPHDLAIPGLDIAAMMEPCTEVGGDYYDIRRVDDGCWIGIGDVAGHGVSAGLVMLMVQCIAAALTGADYYATPARILVGMNEVLYDNVHARMGSDDYVTATILRFYPGGQVVFAGAHEDLVVLRARTGVCEQIETHGTWLGVVPDIRGATFDEQLQLEPGDTLLLYTDGLSEAKDARGEQFGIGRICAALERRPAGPARVALDELIASLRGFTGVLADDVTTLVLRYEGPKA